MEIAPFTLAPAVADLSPRRRSEIRRQIDAAGLETVGLHWLLAKTEGLFITSGDATVRRNTAEYLAELARLCADLGGRIMVLGSPKQRNLAPSTRARRASIWPPTRSQRPCRSFEETGVVVAVEPLGPEETNFLLTAAEAVELIARLGSPHVRLQLDCKSMSGESVPIAELIARHKALLAHFHANDPNRRGPGFGQLDFTPIFAPGRSGLSRLGLRRGLRRFARRRGVGPRQHSLHGAVCGATPLRSEVIVVPSPSGRGIG